MDNNLNNGTLSEILAQLKALNNNLTNSNLIGGDNRLYNNSGRGFGSRNAEAAKERDALRNKIDRLEDALNNEKIRAKDRQNIKQSLRKAKRDYALESAKAAATPAALTTAVKNISNIIFTVLETNIKKQTIKLQAASELQVRAIQTYGKALNNAIGVQVGNITGTVLDTAYQSLSAVIDNGRALYMKNLADAITYRKRENELYKAEVEKWGSIGDSVFGTMAAFGGTVGIIGNILSVVGDITKRAFMYEAKKAEFEIMQSEEVKKAQDEWLQQMESVVKQFSDMSKQVTKSFLEAGNSAYVYGRTMGISGNALRKYHDTLIESVNVALSRIGMDYADYMKMQGSYNAATGGRAGFMATREAMLIGGLSKRLDIGVEEASTIVGAMNIFNTSISDGTDMIFEMSKIANRMGLSATKFAKDMEKNLKLAEKYQFRGGVKGVMEMALWAQRTRFNIEELSSLQEKMLSGNIEDVIQTSARLNVLGGAAALYSDPMAMLYQGLVNPRGLAENINKMISGYGTFNTSTGETEFSTVEMLRLNQIAQATGMSRENLMNQARQAQKSQMIGRRYGNRFSSSALEGITQHATWSRDRNDWIIKVNDPRAEGGFREVGVGELYGDNDERLRNIFPEDKQDRLIDYVKDIRNFLSPGEWQAASEKNSVAVVMGTISRMGMYDRQKLFADERFRMTKENAEENARIVNQITDATWEAQRQMNDAIQNGEMSKLIGTYTDWSLEQNASMLKEMSNFVSTGMSIYDKLIEIEAAVTGKTIQEVTAEKERQAYNASHAIDVMNAINTKYAYRGRDKQREIFNKVMSGEYEFDSETGSIFYYDNGRRKSIRISSIFAGDPHHNTITEADVQRGRAVGDAVITPRGVVYTHPDDMIAAFKPDGALMNNQSYSTLEVNGTLKLEAGSQSVDLVELVKNDPQFFREMTEKILIEANRNKYGGRSLHAPNRFTI